MGSEIPSVVAIQTLETRKGKAAAKRASSIPSDILRKMHARVLKDETSNSEKENTDRL